ncbi:LPO_1073/Vpar_1526 family protein [Lelliottia aquatilis]|uniref:LPO_1073/Vpar_1526 family protein n=1 Tax=Lelliottia aquatilis TaxID=2080838 RepID=UPI00192BE424|nr:LPO_1073/Vpar_1526 family protein [Lelliottia aquatilis]MBL5882571.1 hypothetical protein [Lelliottia aquatilis]
MSLFDNKSGQHVGDGSTAIQVTGDAVIGNTTTEVVTICELVIRAQMASLKEDAYKLVNQRATEFGNQIASKLSHDLDDKLKEKLSDPDIQYSINQAVIQVARKGFNEKSELLKELLISKIQSDEEDESLIIDHALEVTTKLTTNDIKFLSLIYYFRSTGKFKNDINTTTLAETNTTHSTLPDLTIERNHSYHKNWYSNYDVDYIKFLGDLTSLKKINTEILVLKDVTSIGNTYIISYEELLGKRIGLNKIDSDDSFYIQFPAIKNILDTFGIKDLATFNGIVLNPIGSLIAENFLKARGFL